MTLRNSKHRKLSQGLLVFYAEAQFDCPRPISDAMEKEGWTLVLGRSHKDLESNLQAVLPDIFIIDYQLAIRKDAAIIHWLKSSFQFSEIPILIISSEINSTIRTQMVRLGADVVISKPIVIPTLLSNIKFLTKKEILKRNLSNYEHQLDRGWYWNIKQLHAVFTQMDYCSHRTLMDLSKEVEAPALSDTTQLQRIAVVAEIIAYKLKLNETDIKNIRKSACLHDIGNIAIPKKLLQKNGPLEKSEQLLMRKHVDVGAFILEDSELPPIKTAKSMATSHHERWDGEGYPSGLKKDDIPLEGRICAVADVFDALCSDRPYRKAVPVGEAIQIIKSQRNRQFDPKVVDAFLSAKDTISTLGGL